MRLALPRSPLARAAAAAAGGTVFLALGIFLSAGRDICAKDAIVKIANGGTKVRVVTGDGSTPPAVWVDSGDGGSEDAAAASKCGFLGVDVDEDTKSDEGGARVDRVVDDSPAAKAGLKEGDVIVRFNGVVIRGPARLTEQIHAAKPGDTVNLDVRRDGKVQTMSVQMGERPEWTWNWNWKGRDLPGMSEEQIKELEKSLKGLEKQRFDLEREGRAMKMIGPRGRVLIFGTDKPLLGVELVETTPELRQAMGGRKDAGVLIGKVMPGMAAEKAGLAVGDLVLSVDGQAVLDSGDLASAIRERAGKTVDLEIVRDKRTMHLKAAIPEPNEDEGITGPSARYGRDDCPAVAVAFRSGAPAPPAPPALAAPPAPPAPPAPAVRPALLLSADPV